MIRAWLILRDTSGSIVARFDEWIDFEVTQKVNDIDTAQFTINGNDPRTLLFGTDHILEFWREHKEANLPGYRESALFFRDFEWQYDESGQLSYVARFVGLNDLLRRRAVYNYAGGARADKDDAAETCIKEYVDEQAGPSATIAAGRLAEGAFVGLSVEADLGRGDNWIGSKAFDSLLEVCKDIGNSKDIAFRIIPVDLSVPSFIFRAQPKPLGADRTSTGIDPATGRNAAGNRPIIFSDQFDNFMRPRYGIFRSTEGNVAIVIGRGNEEEREYAEVSTVDVTASPWNRCEVTVHATQESDATALTDRGYDTLRDTEKQIIVDGVVVQHPMVLYGRDYFLGDIITTRVTGLEENRTINSVKISIQGRRSDFSENIDIGLGND